MNEISILFFSALCYIIQRVQATMIRRYELASLLINSVSCDYMLWRCNNSAKNNSNNTDNNDNNDAISII